ncbi:MAG: hypothetical protein QOK30_3472 [Nocardioidaceae bacterium]|nr:hypothetical protein [Nocardioidaceae bacterium]
MEDQDLLLPPGAVLVHIGPYKTGSTAIQTTLALHRDDMAPHGVLYPGDGHRQMRPTWALSERGAAGVGSVPMAEWDDLSSEVRAAVDHRVVISSEDLASAKVEQARKLAADLGSDRVHVLIVVRRLDKLFPSSWQERVKSWNETRTYDEWLREVLDEDRSSAAGGTFWRNHGIANLVAVWGAAVPPERIVLLVADEADRASSPRTFEALLGLPDGLLTPGPRENTSLSMDKIELYRQVNQLFKDHGWSARHRRELIYRGMLRGLRQVPQNELDVPIPKVPTWAAERVRDLSRARARQVAGHPGRVVGDPDLLTEVDVGSDEEFATVPDRVPMETAVAAIEAVLRAGLRLEASRTRSRPAAPTPVPPAPADPLEGVDARRLLSESVRRVTGRLGRRAR